MPVLDNKYFLIFCLVVNSGNAIDELVQLIRRHRHIAPILLLFALSAACFALAAGATALEIPMIFMPMGINAGLTAIYFVSRLRTYRPENAPEKTSEMV